MCLNNKRHGKRKGTFLAHRQSAIASLHVRSSHATFFIAQCYASDSISMICSHPIHVKHPPSVSRESMPACAVISAAMHRAKDVKPSLHIQTGKSETTKSAKWGRSENTECSRDRVHKVRFGCESNSTKCQHRNRSIFAQTVFHVNRRLPQPKRAIQSEAANR